MTGNDVSATGAAGFAHGAGVPILTLVDSVVAANRISASSGVTAEGGGLFTTFPVSLTRTVVAGNKPDQCSGC
jgi:hypothetical protein